MTTDQDSGDENDGKPGYDSCPWCSGAIRPHRARIVPVPAQKRDLPWDFDPHGTAYYTDVVCCGDPVCVMRAKRFAELQGWSPEYKLQQMPLWHAQREIDWGYDWMKTPLSRVR